MDERPVTIYGLTDPTNHQLCYIGKSVNVEQRYLNHRSNSMSSWLGSWVVGLRAQQLYPELVIIEEGVHHLHANESEQFWIAYFMCLGSKLLNTHGIKHRFNWSSKEGSKRPSFKECLL
jgi:predicted GIY-YIG superfamily endonuclease